MTHVFCGSISVCDIEGGGRSTEFISDIESGLN